MSTAIRYALSDWDGTLRRGFTIGEWAASLARIGLVRTEVSITVNAMLAAYETRDRSYADLASDTASALAGALRGISAEAVRRAASAFAIDDRARLLPHSLALLRHFDELGLRTAIISGAPAEPILAHMAGMPSIEVHALELETERGVYTGRVLTNPALARVKQRIVDRLLASRTATVVVGVGDTDADLPLWLPASVRVVVRGSEMNPPLPGAVTIVGTRSDADMIRSVLEAAL